jgi:hypothetical protein
MHRLQVVGVFQAFGDRAGARSMIVWQMPAFFRSVPLSLTKLRSSLSSANGSSRNRVEGREPFAEIVDRKRDAVDAQLRRDLVHLAERSLQLQSSNGNSPVQTQRSARRAREKTSAAPPVGA